jgi:hypothetical protein
MEGLRIRDDGLGEEAVDGIKAGLVVDELVPGESQQRQLFCQ